MDLGSAGHAGLHAAVRRFASYDKPMITPKQWGYIKDAMYGGINTWVDEWKTEHGRTGQEGQDATAVQLDEITQTASEITWKAIQDMELPRWETLRYRGEPILEMKFTCDFLPEIPFYGTIDWAVKDREHGGNVVLDYKFREKMTSPEHEEVDLQMPVYQYLLDRNGIGTVGSVKYQIRAAAPRPPIMNKNKQMSRQAILTTWPIYKATLLANGLDPKDYREMEQKLDAKDFFRADRTYRNQFAVANVWHEIILPLGQLFAKSKTQVRHMHYLNCNGCWAREFCLAELRGEDTGFLLETNFVDLTNPKAKLVMRPEDFTLVED